MKHWKHLNFIFIRNNLLIIVYSNVKINLSSLFNLTFTTRCIIDDKINSIYLIQPFLERNMKRRCYLFPRFKKNAGIKLAG